MPFFYIFNMGKVARAAAHAPPRPPPPRPLLALFVTPRSTRPLSPQVALPLLLLLLVSAARLSAARLSERGKWRARSDRFALLESVVFSLTLLPSFRSCAELLRSRRALVAGLGLVLLQQVTGQPSVLYYVDEIFDDVGLGDGATVGSPDGTADGDATRRESAGRATKAVNRFGFWLIGTSQLVPFC